MHLVFMLEELSAKAFLDGLLPRLLPPTVTFRTVAHEGRPDLVKSLRIKLRAWRQPGTRFVVLHDQDKHDCVQLMAELTTICTEHGHEDALVRIACYELEAWYFGDLDAVARVYRDFRADKHRRKARFRVPDSMIKPSVELSRLIPEFQKGPAARALPEFMDLAGNTSRSFQVFVEGVRRICDEPKASH